MQALTDADRLAFIRGTSAATQSVIIMSPFFISNGMSWSLSGKFMRGIFQQLPRDRIELYVLYPAQVPQWLSTVIIPSHLLE